LEASVDAIFQEVSGISTEMLLNELREGGENRFGHRLSKQTKHPNLVFKRGIVKGIVSSLHLGH
jgi:phage tail-like protein